MTTEKLHPFAARLEGAWFLQLPDLLLVILLVRQLKVLCTFKPGYNDASLANMYTYRAILVCRSCLVWPRISTVNCPCQTKTIKQLVTPAAGTCDIASKHKVLCQHVSKCIFCIIALMLHQYRELTWQSNSLIGN